MAITYFCSMSETKKIKGNADLSANEKANLELLNLVDEKLGVIAMGGGAKSAAKQKEKGKMLARERVQYLLDKGSYFLEIGAFAGYEMYEEEGGCASGG